MCLTHENGKDDAEMEQLYLMPGEERYTKFRDENGVPKIRYTYCSLHSLKRPMSSVMAVAPKKRTKQMNSATSRIKN